MKNDNEMYYILVTVRPKKFEKCFFKSNKYKQSKKLLTSIIKNKVLLNFIIHFVS